MNPYMSLYIPRVFLNITEQQISNVFRHYGEVSQVDFVYMDKSDKPYNSVYIYFNYWYNTEEAVYIQSQLTGPEKKVHIVYDNPWYWIVLENHGKRPICVDEYDKLQHKTVTFSNEYFQTANQMTECYELMQQTERVYELEQQIFMYENIVDYQNDLLAQYEQHLWYLTQYVMV